LEHRDYFNIVAEKWDEICQHDTAKLKAIIKMAGISEGQKVLDVGTGTGVMLPFIYELVGKTGEITAIDIAEKMLEVAKQKYPFENIHYVLGDVATAPLPETYYDIIMCYSVFPHFKDKAGIVAHMAGLLKPKGKLVIAHSQSREAINSLHAKLDVVKEDQLPEAVTIEEYFRQAQLVPVLIKDDEEMFVVIGQKN